MQSKKVKTGGITESINQSCIWRKKHNKDAKTWQTNSQ